MSTVTRSPRAATVAWAQSRPGIVATVGDTRRISTVHDPALGYPQLIISTNDNPITTQQGSLALQRSNVEFACIGGHNTVGDPYDAETPDYPRAWALARVLIDELGATTRDGMVVLPDGTWVPAAVPLAPTGEGMDDAKRGVVIVQADMTFIPGPVTTQQGS